VSREARIRGLVKIVDKSIGKQGSPNRLSTTERRFLLKHPDLVRQVFKGERSHMRANEIMRKMKAYKLRAEDVEAVCTWLLAGKGE